MRKAILLALACVAMPLPALAAQCGNSAAGFEAWKREFAGEARAEGRRRVRRRSPDGNKLCDRDDRG